MHYCECRKYLKRFRQIISCIVSTFDIQFYSSHHSCLMVPWIMQMVSLWPVFYLHIMFVVVHRFLHKTGRNFSLNFWRIEIEILMVRMMMLLSLGLSFAQIFSFFQCNLGAFKQPFFRNDFFFKIWKSWLTFDWITHPGLNKYILISKYLSMY